VHVLNHGCVSFCFLLHRECNLGFSPFNTRRDTFFYLALYRFRLFCFVRHRQAVYAIPCLIDKYSEPRLRMQYPSSVDSGVGFSAVSNRAHSVVFLLRSPSGRTS
jgi:hypothetical protein